MRTNAKTIWFVVANSGQSRGFVFDKDARALSELGEAAMSAPDVRTAVHNLKSDRPGRSFSSSGGNLRHSIEPHHDYHKAEKHKFIAGLAAFLDESVSKKQFDHLVIAAPQRSLGELRKVLSDRVRATVSGEIAKDLTKAPMKALGRQLIPIACRLAYSLPPKT
jgi:protein required for attachment to host cells